MSELYTKQVRFNVRAPEIRSDGDRTTLTGTAVVYDSPSELIFGYFREYIRPGCFDAHLADKPDVMAFRDHRPDRILGRVSARTLRLLPTKTGIDVECDMPRTTYGLDLAESIKRGDVKGMSFGFDVTDDEWFTEDGTRCRSVKGGKLYEVSFVTMPAYPATDAGIRALVDSKCGLPPNVQQWNRLRGYERSRV